MNDFTSWQAELLLTGEIVQDGDDSVPWPERERRFNRYVALVEAVTGNEGPSAAAALIRSMQSRDDYGAYQATQTALGRFPDDIYVAALLQEFPALLARQPDWAGELLCGVANAAGTRFAPVIAEFRRQLQSSPPDLRATVQTFIHAQEQRGWLKHRVGVLAP